MLNFQNINLILFRDFKTQFNLLKGIKYKKLLYLKIWFSVDNLSLNSYSAIMQFYSLVEEICAAKASILAVHTKKTKKIRQKSYILGVSITNSILYSKVLNYFLKVVLISDLKYSKLQVFFTSYRVQFVIQNISSFVGVKIWYFALVNLPIIIDINIIKDFSIKK